MMRNLAILTVAALLPLAAAANGGAMMGGSGVMGGGGMLVVADDGSLLVTEMGMGAMMGTGSYDIERAIVSIGPNGNERWRVTFDDGWPRMVVTDGDLVVVSLVDDWWTGLGGSGDTGWGPGGGTGQVGSHDDTVTLVGLRLATGAELWRTELEGEMGAMIQFAPDGSRLYVSVMAVDGSFGGGSMHQGDASMGGFGETTVYALDRNGVLLWSLLLDGGGMGGTAAGER